MFRKGCRSDDGECKLKKSIIVWKPEEVRHDCPYEIVQTPMPYERVGDTVLTNRTSNQYLFKIEERLIVCPSDPIVVYKTTTGLLVTKAYNTSVEKQIKYAFTQSNTALQMITAENDYRESLTFEHRIPSRLYRIL